MSKITYRKKIRHVRTGVYELEIAFCVFPYHVSNTYMISDLITMETAKMLDTLRGRHRRDECLVYGEEANDVCSKDLNSSVNNR